MTYESRLQYSISTQTYDIIGHIVGHICIILYSRFDLRYSRSARIQMMDWVPWPAAANLIIVALAIAAAIQAELDLKQLARYWALSLGSKRSRPCRLPWRTAWAWGSCWRTEFPRTAWQPMLVPCLASALCMHCSSKSFAPINIC